LAQIKDAQEECGRVRVHPYPHSGQIASCNSALRDSGDFGIVPAVLIE
jgi:hypothetical protein